MSEPITEVWLLTFRTKQGRVERALYLDEKLATSQSHLLTGRGLGDVAVSRLPLATPEMVECVNAVRQFGDFAGKVEAQSKQGADLSERFDLAEERNMCHGRLLLAAQKLAAIDAARAAGGAHDA